VNATVADGPVVAGGTLVRVGAAGTVRSMVNVRAS
jgi:hypothetical protein